MEKKVVYPVSRLWYETMPLHPRKSVDISRLLHVFKIDLFHLTNPQR